MRLGKSTSSLAEKVSAWRSDPMRFVADVLPDYHARLDPWQREDLHAVLTSSKHAWLERPRGHSKTQDLAIAMLTGLVLGPPGWRGYLAAVDQAQAGLAYDSLRQFVAGSPFLRSIVRLLRAEAVVPATDNRLVVLPADSAGAWGLRPDLVGLDELSAWRTQAHEEFAQALLSALGKRPGARAVVATTAHWDRSGLCWRLRETVQTDPAWLFLRRGQCASWISPAFLDQQRRILPDHAFRVLHLNEWVTSTDVSYLSSDEVRSIFDPRRTPADYCRVAGHVVAVDLGLKRDAAVAVVLHGEAPTDRAQHAGLVVVDTIRTWKGSAKAPVKLADVKAWVLQAVERYAHSTVILDAWQAEMLAQELRAAGVRVRTVAFTAPYRQRLFAHLLALVRERRLLCYPHPALEAELLRLEWRGDRVDHPRGSHDDHVVALGMGTLEVTDYLARPRTAILTHITLPPSWQGVDDWLVEHEQALLERGALDGMMRDMRGVELPIGTLRGPWSRYGF